MSLLMAIDLIGLGIAYFFTDDSSVAQVLCIILILTFVMLFEFSLGPIVWLYLAEILNDKALSVAVVLNWIFNLIISLITPQIISGYLFIVLGVFCGIVRYFYF